MARRPKFSVTVRASDKTIDFDAWVKDYVAAVVEADRKAQAQRAEEFLMQKATLSGIPGYGRLTLRLGRDQLKQLTGIFYTAPEHEAALWDLWNTRNAAGEFDGEIDDCGSLSRGKRWVNVDGPVGVGAGRIEVRILSATGPQ